MTDKYKYIKHAKLDDSAIHIISINRPKKLNACSPDTFKEIGTCIMKDVNPIESGARVLIFTGEGKHYTAGLDLSNASEAFGKSNEDLDVARKGIRASISL